MKTSALAAAGAAAIFHPYCYAEKMDAWIALVHEAGTLSIVPHVRSENHARISYSLISHKQGTSGKSRSRQSGYVELAPGKAVPLSTLIVGVGKDDHYRFKLNIYHRSLLTATASVEYP